MICFTWIVFFFFYCYGDHRDLHSFPTRRSSDLLAAEEPRVGRADRERRHQLGLPDSRCHLAHHREDRRVGRRRGRRIRSEEHTSELQSHVNLVCRLLLEKKKNKREKHKAMVITT